jgi:hypothetical protein
MQILSSNISRTYKRIIHLSVLATIFLEVLIFDRKKEFIQTKYSYGFSIVYRNKVVTLLTIGVERVVTVIMLLMLYSSSTKTKTKKHQVEQEKLSLLQM